MANELVELLRFATSAEAAVVRSTLEAAGIASVLQGETMAGWFWQLDAATGGVRVLVWRDQLEKARAVLDAIPGNAQPNQDDFAGDEDGYDEESEDQYHIVEGGGYAADDEYTEEDELRQELTRAWRAAVIGIVFFPPLLTIYSLVLLFRGNLLFDERTRGNWRGPASLLVNAVVILGLVFLVAWLINPPQREWERDLQPDNSGPVKTVPFYEQR